MSLIYDNMKFPPYEFREFPKWVSIDGVDTLAVDAEHEASLRKIAAHKAGDVKRGPGRPPKAPDAA